LGIISPFKKWINRFFLIFFVQLLGAVLVSPIFYANLLKEDIRDSDEQVIENSWETEIEVTEVHY